MSTSNDGTIKTLNHLIQTCKDGERGYRTAASHVQSVDLMELFDRLSLQRAAFAEALQADVQRLGGAPATHGTIIGTIFRGWMNLKSEVRGDDELAVLEECERCEEWALEAYQQALQESLPTEVDEMIRLQFAHIQDAHAEIKALTVGSGV
jgi:uncharacterized protein (TIGR02284 family)